MRNSRHLIPTRQRQARLAQCINCPPKNPTWHPWLLMLLMPAKASGAGIPWLPQHPYYIQYHQTMPATNNMRQASGLPQAAQPACQGTCLPKQPASQKAGPRRQGQQTQASTMHQLPAQESNMAPVATCPARCLHARRACSVRELPGNHEQPSHAVVCACHRASHAIGSAVIFLTWCFSLLCSSEVTS